MTAPGLRFARVVLTLRSLPVLLAVLAMALTAPSVRQGWVADDLLQREMLLRSSLPAVLQGLFVLVGPEKRHYLMEAGGAPWWTLDTLRISFFRPLAGLSHWVDYQWWPDSGVLMHAQSILWYGGVCALAALVYRRFMGPTWVAGLAAFLFATDFIHLGSVGWLANRNGLMAIFFGLLSLLAHDRWRREGRRAGAVLASLWLALAVLSAEAGVATVTYLLAYAVFLDPGPWRRRLGSLVPYAAVLVGWQYAYRGMGYGTWGSAFYLDPVGEPARFAAAVLERGPVLLLSQWTGLLPGIYNLLSVPARRAMWLVAVVSAVFLSIVLAPLMRRDSMARAWALAMILAVVPACSISLLSGRLLLFTGVGAMGLMAQLIGEFLDRREESSARAPWRVPVRVLCVLLIGLHVIVAPILMPVAANSPDVVQTFITQLTDIGPIAAGRQAVVIVNAPSPFNFLYAPSKRWLQGDLEPAPIRVLAPGYSSVDLTRLDNHTVVVRPEQGYLVPSGARGSGRHGRLSAVHIVHIYEQLDGFFRGPAFPMALGEQVMLAGMHVEVTSLTEDGRPAEARVRFGLPLDDPALTWLSWDWRTGEYVRFVLPAPGATVRIPGPP